MADFIDRLKLPKSDGVTNLTGFGSKNLGDFVWAFL